MKILTDLGIDLIRLPADPAFPDGCFVEDACVMLPAAAVITNPGAPSRAGETESVARAVAPFMETHRIGGGTLDGGDVLRLGGTYLIGLSGRTDKQGADELGRIAREHGAEAQCVEVPFGLHLKSAVTPLSPDAVLGLPAFLADPAFDGTRKVVVPEDEAARRMRGRRKRGNHHGRRLSRDQATAHPGRVPGDRLRYIGIRQGRRWADVPFGPLVNNAAKGQYP